MTCSADPLALTFILPTRNRRAYVGRAIESCLQAERPGVEVHVLVVDGNSTDGSYEELQRCYGSNSRVRLVRQTGPKGFMAACFLAVPQVRTPFATFMYDDDVLSPFWGDLPMELKRRGAEFIMGFSVEGVLENIVPFERVTRLRVVPPSLLLRAFFGCGHEISAYGLPFSPICCLTRTDRLKEWVSELNRFTAGRPLREYFMMQRNAGPDLMIYLHSIARHRGSVAVFDGPVAQFSAHAESFTSGLESTDLPIGYWLAGVWLCDCLQKQGADSDAGWCAAYLVKQGLRLAVKRMRRGRVKWLALLLGEIAGLARLTLGSRAGPAFLKSLVILVCPRGWRPRFGLSICTETLLT